MRRWLMVALLLTGCGPKSPAGVWVQQRSSCEILSDNTVVTSLSHPQANLFRVWQALIKLESRAKVLASLDRAAQSQVA
ncbi:MAG: hypothetical protein U0931_31355 [Vulcanimicrobiota bacterium]